MKKIIKRIEIKLKSLVNKTKFRQELKSIFTESGQEMPITPLLESTNEIIAKYQDKSAMLKSKDESIKIEVLQVKGDQALAVWAKLRTAVVEIKAWPVILTGHLREVLSSREVGELILKASSLDAHNWLNQQKAEFLNGVEYLDKPSLINTHPLNSFSTHIDVIGSVIKPKSRVLIGLIPTINSWEVPAYFGFGGWNTNPQPEVHISLLKYWKKLYDAEIVSLSHDTLELYVNRPPTDWNECLELSKMHFLYCDDRVADKGADETFQSLSSQLCNGKVWHFWWD